MERAASPIPRKLVEAVFRRFWLLLLPVIAVPVLVTVLVSHPQVYESTSTAWVTDISGLGSSPFTAEPSFGAKSPSERQVEILSDLLATRSFREAVAAEAGLITAADAADLRAAVADDLWGRLAAVAAGPNLVTVKASAPSAEEAHKLAAAFVSQYQLRAHTESAREAATILAYFDEQVAAAEADVAETRAAIAAYVAANPRVTATPDAEYQRLLALSGVQESLLARVLESQDDAELAAASITAGVQSLFVVQDLPQVPSAPLGIPLMERAAYPAAGLLLGVFISAAFLWVAYRTDRTIRSADDIDPLEVAVLGVIPELAPADIARRFTPLRWAGFLRRDYARQVAASIPPLVDQEKVA